MAGQGDGRGCWHWAPLLEAGQREDPWQSEGHPWRKPWFLPLKNGPSLCQCLLWNRHGAGLSYQPPAFVGTPEKGAPFLITGGGPALGQRPRKCCQSPRQRPLVGVVLMGGG